MFQAYVAVGSKKNLGLVNANPYIMVVEGQSLYLKETNKEKVDGIVFYLLDELTPEEIYLFKNAITVIGVSDIIRLRKSTLR